MDGEGVESPPESSKRGREDSPKESRDSSKRRDDNPEASAKSSQHNISRTRIPDIEHTTTIVTPKTRVTELARNGLTAVLIKRLLDAQHLPQFSRHTKKVNDQMLQLRSMVPTASNILLTDVKIFYFALPKDQRDRPFKKMYRYVFFRFEDAIFSLKLTEQTGENYLFAAAALPFIFRDNNGQICTLGNLLQSNSSVASAIFENATNDSYEKSKNCRIDNQNNMLRRDIRKNRPGFGPQKEQEYDNLVQALQDANDSNELQMVVPNLESLGMLLLKIGIGIDKDAIKQIFGNNPNIHFPNMTLPEINAAIDKGIHLSQMLQREVSGRRGGSRRYSTKRRSLRKSRTIKKRK